MQKKIPICIKFETQPEQDYCTVSCVRMLLKAHGLNVPYSRLKKILHTIRGLGTPPLYTPSHRGNTQVIKNQSYADRLLQSDLNLTKKGIFVKTEVLPGNWEKILQDYLDEEIYPIAHLEISPDPYDSKVKFGCSEFRISDPIGHDVIVTYLNRVNKTVNFLDPLCQIDDGMSTKQCYGISNPGPTSISYQSFERYIEANGRYITTIYRHEEEGKGITLYGFENSNKIDEEEE